MDKDMTISQYLVTLQNDKGKVTIQTAAVSPAQAARIVTDSEAAPLSAVIKVEELGQRKPRQNPGNVGYVTGKTIKSSLTAADIAAIQGEHITKIKV